MFTHISIGLDWHGPQAPSPGTGIPVSTDEMQITVTTSGVGSTLTSVPDGYVLNVPLLSLPSCVTTIAVASQCNTASDLAEIVALKGAGWGGANSYNDW